MRLIFLWVQVGRQDCDHLVRLRPFGHSLEPSGMLQEKLLENGGATAGTPQQEEPPEKRSREDWNS